MQPGALTRAADWIRHALPGIAHEHGASPAQDGSSREGLSAHDLKLLEFLASDVADRARSLRTAVRSIECREDALSSVLDRVLGEVEQLDELAASVSDLVVQSKGPCNLQTLDLLDPFRRARARLARRPGGGIRVRVNAPSRPPRVLANEAALVRTIALCLEASALGAGAAGAIVVRVEDDTDRIRARFRSEASSPYTPPSARDRIRAALALASRLAATFGADVGAAADGPRLVPTLTLLPEPGV